jgi:hypothetical protein
MHRWVQRAEELHGYSSTSKMIETEGYLDEITLLLLSLDCLKHWVVVTRSGYLDSTCKLLALPKFQPKSLIKIDIHLKRHVATFVPDSRSFRFATAKMDVAVVLHRYVFASPCVI